jgi:deazaflavin-dependent oxidoreductase (nitroreductase family)
MVTTAPRARPRSGRKESTPSPIASGFFSRLNQFIEPVAREGCFSPDFWPTGLILLETTGRRTGKPHLTPVLAMQMDGHVIVRTFRGERSEWFKNLRANPDVAYWTNGQRRQAWATVHTPGEECPTESLPPFAALGVAGASVAVGLMGWRFAVLAPRD